MLQSSCVMDAGAVLEQMIETVREAASPERIFRQHNLLLIVLSSQCTTSFTDIKLRLEASAVAHRFDYTLCLAADLERQLSQGHLFYSTLCTREHLVYDSGVSSLPLPLSERIQRVKTKAVQDFTAGFHRAEAFLNGATFYLASGENALAAFMLHQGAEQAIRAILFALTGQEVKTHTLSELNQHLKRYGLAQETFLSGRTGADRRLLERLEKAYTCARYTHHFEISQEDLFQLLARVKTLMKVLEHCFEELIKRYAGSAASHSLPINQTV